MKVKDFTFQLPPELIAQKPPDNRADSRLLLLDGTTGRLGDEHFENIHRYLLPTDLLVVNNTKVIPARLYGKKKDTGGKIEILLLNNIRENLWEVILKPGRRALKGAEFLFGDGSLKARILEVKPDGNRIVEFIYEGIFIELLERIGVVPLPPYIKEELEDKDRYQTIYAKIPGSAAAPTAGLHFNDVLLDKLKSMGVKFAEITLDIGLGTFRPVKTENVEDHIIHSEHYEIGREACDLINDTLLNKGRIIGVGTTSIRVLESACGRDGRVYPQRGQTDIFIYPGYKFKIADAMITNFHLPGSTLIMLVSAFGGRENILRAYDHAIKEKYRFFSFGDAMFIYNRRMDTRLWNR